MLDDFVFGTTDVCMAAFWTDDLLFETWVVRFSVGTNEGEVCAAAFFTDRLTFEQGGV